MKAMILIPFHHRSENIQIDESTVRFDITLVRGPFQYKVNNEESS